MWHISAKMEFCDFDATKKTEPTALASFNSFPTPFYFLVKHWNRFDIRLVQVIAQL